MFNTQEIGRKISTLRKMHNMTQMQLADEMAVSYQAVSNWERGNSMPDISKLPDLAQIFHISIDELLGDSKETKIVEQLVSDEEVSLSVDELKEVAVLLPPTKTEKLAERAFTTDMSGESLGKIAPFVSQEYLDELMIKCTHVSFQDLTMLAPFLQQETLSMMVHRIQHEGFEIKHLVSLAPFMKREDLGELVLRADFSQNISALSAVAPFVSQEILIQLIDKWQNLLQIKGYCSIAPFLPKGTLNQIVLEHSGDLKEVCGLLPFLDQEVLKTLAERCLEENNMRMLAMLAPFLQ